MVLLVQDYSGRVLSAVHFEWIDQWMKSSAYCILGMGTPLYQKYFLLLFLGCMLCEIYNDPRVVRCATQVYYVVPSAQ